MKLGPVNLTAEFEPTDEIVSIGGREAGEVNTIFGEQIVDMIAKGYVCIECFEPQETAFPIECAASWCRFPMRDQQSLRFIQKFKGKDEHSAERKYDQEELDERARAEYQKKGIWLPPAR